ncbi:hypothetical protein BB737_02440 [Mycobacterium avium subsp. hominissuis]|uniref:UsfY protein n=1 Tax=Mycobacterium paraffinicum TaxID=53378 RepID=A0ABP8F3C1_9MYCO|nr:hypothetical protein BI294_10900 [Mycobacterium avium subsp. hominissuis]PBJ67388.1 hypothetical protein BB737_02440 [Mycobacterium avium subsp. hominissuis]BAN91964.1 hypothetical protein MAH_p132 [Mycobacterium avium subsp. hominissuis TH135]
MRVVIGVAFITTMGCVFTLMTATIFLTQHPFASLVLTGLAAACVAAAVRRRSTRRSQPHWGHPATVTDPHMRAVSRLTAAQMSSAIVPRRTRRDLP